MTADAIREYANGTSWRDAGREVWQHRAEGSNAGNGSVMRCAPHARLPSPTTPTRSRR